MQNEQPTKEFQISPEMRVRTMQADLDAVERGGVAPGEQSGVPASYAPSRGEFQTFKREEGRELVIRALSSPVVVAVSFIIALIILGFLGYYLVYERSTGTALFPQTPQAPPSPISPLPSTPPQQPEFNHQSFFRLPTARTMAITLPSGPAVSAEDLETFAQKLTRLMGEVVPQIDFVELAFQNEEGLPLVHVDFLGRIETLVFSSGFLSQNFNPDFTGFAYRDKKGIWPGYVFRAAQGLTELLLGPEIKKIEESSLIANFFLSPPSFTSPIVFRDETVLERSVRSATLAPGVQFSYAWFNNNTLVFSTSKAGLERAFEHLGR